MTDLRLRSKRLFVATATALAAVLPMTFSGVAEAAPLVATSTTTTRVVPNATTALDGLSIGGSDGAATRVTLSTDVGTLSISTTTNLTLAFANAWSGTGSITFSGLEADINNALATASITTPAGDTTASVSLTAAPDESGFFYESSDQRIFEFVAASGVSWTAADAAARARSYRGQPGYLAAPVTAAANDFITAKIQGATDVWIGLRAYESGTNAEYDGTSYARVWRAVVGADQSPEAGTVVGVCTNLTGDCDDFDSGNYFSSWASAEPNNAGSNESAAVTNWNGGAGEWNDLAPGPAAGIGGYVVQYGGKTNNDPSLGTGFDGIVTDTSEVLVSATASAPEAPTVGAESGDDSVTLSWTPPANGGEPITSYEVAVDGGGFSPVTTTSSDETVDGNVVTTISTTVTGLTNGVSYDFQVRAVNSVGDGTPSASVSETPLAVPGAPTAVSGTLGDESVVVSFTAPADNGGAAITQYTATAAPGGATATCVTSPCTVNGLTNGSEYTFTVTATNSVGTSAASTPSAGVTPSTVPGGPTGVSGTPGDSSISVSFVAPADNGGSAITGYTVTGSPGGIDVDCASSPCEITGLTNGTEYTLSVVATNVAGDGASSAPVATTPRTVPGVVVITDVTPENASAVVAFGTPANGGAAIADYTATASPGGATATCATSPCTVNGLTNGTEYAFTVTARNAAGSSSASSAVGATPRTIADPPGAPTIEQNGVGSAIVTFDTPESDGGAPITGYIVTVSPGGATTVCAASPCVVENLPTGSPVTFTVSADNAAGGSTSSGSSAPVELDPLPDAPGDVTVTSTPTSITVTFDDSSPLVTSYEVVLQPGNIRVTCTASPCEVDDLVPGVKYSVTVIAIGPAGSSTGGVVVDTTTDRATGGFVSMSSVRLVDTRQSDRLGGGETLEVDLTGAAGLPADASSIVLNVTAVRPGAAGFLSIVPCGTDDPATSNINYRAGVTRAGSAVVDVRGADSICIYSHADTDVVVDLDGATSPTSGTSRLHAVQPERAFDSRMSGARVPADSITRVDLDQIVPADADAVVVTTTVVDASDSGYVTVFSCDGDVPMASNVNFPAGLIVPNSATTDIGQDGEICVYSPVSTDLVVDVMAYYSLDPQADVVRPVEPQRLADTRVSGASVQAGEVLVVEVPSASGPAPVAAVVNVAALQPQDSGYLTVFRCADERPLSSNVNYVRGDNSANSAVVATDDAGQICVYASATTHVAVDLFAVQY